MLLGDGLSPKTGRRWTSPPVAAPSAAAAPATPEAWNKPPTPLSRREERKSDAKDGVHVVFSVEKGGDEMR